MQKTIFIYLFLLSSITGFSQDSKKFSIYFNSGDHSLNAVPVKTLDSIVSIIDPAKAYEIIIVGYTDPEGSIEGNYELGLNRALALKKHLVNRKISEAFITESSRGELESADVSLTDAKRRRVDITIKNIRPGVAGEFEERSFRGDNGTIVTGTFPKTSGAYVTINEIFTSESMIKNDLYAVDVNGNILVTDGMFEICTENLDFDPTGQFYLVKVPTWGRPNDKMTLWIAEQVNSSDRWRNTPIEVTIDADRQYYTFKIPATEKCVKINLDMPCIRENGCEVVFVGLYKPSPFYDVQVKNESNELGFSAKLNDTLYAFTKMRGESMTDMKFIGMRRSKKTFEIRLDKCIYTRERGVSTYYICEECVRTKKKGFFAWLRKVITGKQQYEDDEEQL